MNMKKTISAKTMTTKHNSNKPRFCITYQRVTPESAEYGDFAEHGWYQPGGYEYPLQDNDGHHNDVLEQAKTGEFDLNFSDAISAAIELGINDNSGSDWLQSYPEQDYHDGSDVTYCLHIENVTPSTYNRIARLLQS